MIGATAATGYPKHAFYRVRRGVVLGQQVIRNTRSLIAGHGHRTRRGEAAGAPGYDVDWRRRMQVEPHSPELVRGEDAGSQLLVSVARRLDFVVGGRTHHYPIWRTPRGELRRLAPPAAVVRRQEYIAMVGLLGHHIVEPWRLQIPRKQDATPRVFYTHCHAIRVVVRLFCTPQFRLAS
jgi:hypothetical protein